MRSGLPALCLAFACLGLTFAHAQVPPFVVTHPASVSAYPGDPVTVSATIDGTAPISYQWRKDGVAVPGATNPSISLTATLVAPATFSGALYDVVATNLAGSVTTMSAMVYVTRRPQTITFAPTPTVVPAGTGVALSATSSSSLPVAFTLVSGSGSFGGNVVSGGGGNVVVRATQAGNATFAPADPVDRTITFVAGALSPFITTPPTDQTALAGTSLSLRVTAIGTPTPAYQWQKDGVALTGATTAALTIPSLTLADAGRYSVTLTNLAGVATAAATVVVRAAPVLLTSPASQTVTAGDSTTLAVEAAAFPVPTFQWRKNGTAIVGATRSTYTLAGVTSANAGTYDVVVTNALGSVTSPAAVLTIFTRNFIGTYFGRFAGTTGDFALLVRADGTAAFLGALPALSAGLVGLRVNVDLGGNFSATLPLITATARSVSLRGSIDEVAGTVTGTLAEINATFDGARAVPRDPLPPQAGLYSAALVGSASGQGYVLVAPDGQALLLTASGTSVDSARGTLGASGRLAATTGSQATVDLGFNNGALSGTVRTGTGPAGTIAGAIEGLAGTEHLVNLSVRGIATPAAPMITGFVIGGTVAKQVLIRAAGPALARAPFNINTALADPSIQLYRGNVLTAQNNDWGTPNANTATISAAAARVGAFPFGNNSADSAILTTLLPGVYSVQIEGGTGLVLAEIYEVPVANEAAGSRRLINASTLGVVAPDFPLVAGFVINGSAPQRLLVRAIGPTLAAAPFNLPSTLPNPQITLYRGSTIIRTNDDWFRDPEAAAIRDAAAKVRAFALGAQSLDAAFLGYLEPGAYTVVVSGPANANATNSTGLTLVEVYEATP